MDELKNTRENIRDASVNNSDQHSRLSSSDILSEACDTNDPSLIELASTSDEGIKSKRKRQFSVFAELQDYNEVGLDEEIYSKLPDEQLCVAVRNKIASTLKSLMLERVRQAGSSFRQANLNEIYTSMIDVVSQSSHDRVKCTCRRLGAQKMVHDDLTGNLPAAVILAISTLVEETVCATLGDTGDLACVFGRKYDGTKEFDESLDVESTWLTGFEGCSTKRRWFDVEDSDIYVVPEQTTVKPSSLKRRCRGSDDGERE